MKRQARIPAQLLAVSIVLIIAIGAMAGRTASAATTTVGLGTAANYSVLAGTAVTNTGPTTTDRDVGVSPGTSVGGFPPGIVGGTIHAGDSVALQAQNDLIIAYNDAAGRTPFTNVTGNLGGQTLVGGVYRGGALNLTGTLTLDGQNDPSSVWIFQAASDLITASSSSVSFINGASPCNVFWQIGSSATLGTGSTFVGTIMALTSIAVTTGVTVYGRALARNGAVTLDNDRFLTSACSVGAQVPIPPTRPPFTVAPSATPTPTATPTPIVAPVATPTPTVAPGTTPTPTVAPGTTPTPTVASTPPAAAAPIAPSKSLKSLPATSTQDLDGVPTWVLVLSLAAFALLGTLVRARDRVTDSVPKI